MNSKEICETAYANCKGSVDLFVKLSIRASWMVVQHYIDTKKFDS